MGIKLINGCEVKDHCVSCGAWIGFSLSNYQVRGNFCPECNGHIILRVRKTAEERTAKGIKKERTTLK